MSGEVPDGWSRKHRQEDQEFERRQQLRRNLETLGLSEAKFMELLRSTPGFWDIVKLALAADTTYESGLELYQAELKKSQQPHVPAQIPSGQVHTYNKGMTFGETSRLKRKMRDEADQADSD